LVRISPAGLVQVNGWQYFEADGSPSVDSHKEVHVAAAVDHLGRALGTTCGPTTTQGAVWLWIG
jgi:hypothetical protein